MTLYEIVIIAIVVAAAFGFVAHLLKQPAIIGFMIAGFVIGSLAIFEIGSLEAIESLASIGITLLLFIVGLEMNFKELKHVGLVSLLTGLGQIIFTFIVGFLIITYLGFSFLPAIYIAIALTFSSTIIIIKLLSEKGDLNSLYGRISVGFLLVQDFVAILILIFLAGLQAEGGPGMNFLITLIKGFILFGLTILVSYFLPKVLHFIGSSPELLFLFSLGWSLGIAALVNSPLIGLSKEIGGFLAGLALANSSEHFQIGIKLRPLRDFFIILFFVGLGAQLVAGSLVNISHALLLSLFVLIGNPLIVLIIMSFLGYRSKTSFSTSLTVAQISEFSFIIMALGLAIGHVSPGDVSLVIMVGIITIFISSYLIIYNDWIYNKLKKFLVLFEFRRKKEEIDRITVFSNHIILIGAHRLGQGILKALLETGQQFIVVDFDPKIVEKLKNKGVNILFGDASDEETQQLAGFSKAKLIISTAPSFGDNIAIFETVKRINSQTKIILTANNEWSAQEFYKLGADYVLLPHFLGGEHLAKAIKDDYKYDCLKTMKEADLASLNLF